MKASSRSSTFKSRWFAGMSLSLAWLGVFLLACTAGAWAAEADSPSSDKPSTNAPSADAPSPAKPSADKPSALTPEQMFEGGTTAYNNWVEFSAGGFLTQGNRAQAEQNHRLSRSAFGGIEDFHYQKDVATNTTLTVNGRALFDEHDYKLSLELVRPELGFLRFNYQQFRTWYNGDGGFFPPANAWFPLSGNALALDRGEVSFAAGLTKKKLPQITFRYTHQFRDGEKGSTIWGLTHPDFTSEVRGLGPAFDRIDETRDIFELDATHQIKATEFGVGLRYEIGQFNNTRYVTQWPGEPVQTRITDRENTSDNTFSTHAFSETKLSKVFTLTTGFLFANLDNAIAGSRIYGSDFDVGYVPTALNGFGYYNLNGILHERDYVMDLNLMATPRKNLTVIPSIRVQKEDWGADSGAFQTQGAKVPTYLANDSFGNALDVQERLDVRYAGVTNWVFYTRGEWNQGDGNLHENGGFGLGAPIHRATEDGRFFQKYTAGARWYPARTVTLDFGGYYKNNAYDYDHVLDSTANDPTGPNRYPAFLVMQGFQTFDGNLRLTLRPARTVTLVSRYEYQLSTIDARPDPVSTLDPVESSKMTSHIFAQDISWTPWSRLYLQAGFNYVVSDTRTPTADYTSAILNAQNNYWTVSFNSGFVVDDKTDLNAGYFFYQSDNYQDNSTFGVPFGAAATEHGVTALLTRRLTKNLRLKVRYGYYHCADVPSGANANYAAHVLFTSLQYRF